ncbi:hypothetical protein [Thalassotalea atypica]|uniref:hypothetical protein n=1 Tax=Thalassotalea atypica TaxID=2054316 RepID=UPI002573C904|nr:hypothetical protein [Thalassotalea atypica]
MNNRSEDNIPNIVLDNDDVEAYKSTKKQKAATPSKQAVPSTPVKAKTPGFLVFTSVLIYMLVGGAGYWFYQQDLQNKALLQSSERRIVELEKQLSATGEEMGESTVALKAKLEGLIQKTDTLWKEMDKLWASAWRKNQSEIKALVAQNKKQATLNSQNKASFVAASGFIKEVQENQTLAEFNVSALSEKLDQLQQLKGKFDDLTAQYNTLESKSSQRDKSQLEVATSLNQLEMSVNALLDKVERLQTTPTKSSTPQPVNAAPPVQ